MHSDILIKEREKMKSMVDMVRRIRKRKKKKAGQHPYRVWVTGFAALLFLCWIGIQREAIAAACYETTLFGSTAMGRWVKSGQYEPDTLYEKTLNKVLSFRYVRMQTMQQEKKQTKEKQEGESEIDSETVPYEQIQYEKEVENENKINRTTKQKTDEKKQEKEEKNGSLEIRYVHGAVTPLPVPESEKGEVSDGVQDTVLHTDTKPFRTVLSMVKEQYRWKEPAEQMRFLNNYYIADVSVGDVSNVIDGEKLLSLDTSLGGISEEPQILIYHTHATEGYKNSRPGVEADTVVGMGDVLLEELTEKGFSVLHDRTTYDFVNGSDNRNYAYTTARPQIEALLKEYPSIEVILDIHRDSGAARRTEINGQSAAQVMLFNGLCRNADGPISYLSNPYLDNTLAFSLQLNLLGRERYPGLMYKIYLKNYRYNMHFTGHCMLVELGTEQNTVEEARLGIRYFAELLYELLTERK